MFGIDDAIFGSLIGAGSQLLGGILGSNSTAKANQRAQDNANFAAQGGNLDAYLYNVRKAADAHGFNPLNVLGLNTAGGPSSVAGDPGASLASGVSGAGQDISRAMTAYADKNDKSVQLNNELIQAKINQTNATTAGQQLENSKLARTFAAPGSPPGLRSRPGSVKPAYAPYDSWPYSLLSHDAASTQFGPTSIVTGAELLPGLVKEQAVGTYNHIAPYVRRAINNLSIPDGPIGNPAGDFVP